LEEPEESLEQHHFEGAKWEEPAENSTLAIVLGQEAPEKRLMLVEVLELYH
jgi:hypothetical protein